MENKFTESLVSAIQRLADPNYEIDDNEAIDIAYGFARYGITTGWNKCATPPQEGAGMSEKPLHVQVAEALGCRLARGASKSGEFWICDCPQGPYEDVPHGNEWSQRCRAEIHRYDTDWAATGPLIKQHKISLLYCWPGDVGQDGFIFRAGWGRDENGNWEFVGDDATPLIAVCNLILNLKKAGKL